MISRQLTVVQHPFVGQLFSRVERSRHARSMHFVNQHITTNQEASFQFGLLWIG